jgi:hypothetical protein
MLNRIADERLIKSLVQLRPTNEFKAFMSWLQESRGTLMTDMAMQRDEINLRHQQGALQVLDEIAQAVEQSPTLLPK